MILFGAFLAIAQTTLCPVVLNPVQDGHLCITGTVTKVDPQRRIVYDGKAYWPIILSEAITRSNNGTVGDLIVANCHWMKNEVNHKILILKDSSVIGKSAVPPVRDASIAEILVKRRYFEHLRVRGRVIDIKNDEIDPRYVSAVVRDPVSDDSLLVPFSRELTSGVVGTSSRCANKS